MKRSRSGKAVRLVKNYIEDEKSWGVNELIRERAPRVPATPAPQEKKVPAAVNENVGSYSADAHMAITQYPKTKKRVALEALHARIAGCTKCGLSNGRLNIVVGDGNPDAELMFVGEGPGFDEDHQGLPFIGRAGQLLTKIIEAMGLKRPDVFIANIVKCHPMIDPSDPEKRGNDRPPHPDEVAACRPYLEAQIDIIKPKCICLLGNSALKALLPMDETISKVRGQFFEYRGALMMPTYHPAALLRNPSLKKDVWEDMKKIRDEMKK